MGKALIVYYSRSGNTRKMAQAIAEAIKNEGVETTLKKQKKITVD